ncbi:MAG: prepilin-type N-terminal cleavage/methylation domain-containing protein [Nitrospirae bacterium]|nr:prepilin-type N-terminal cleavage/methylation domain-containing protein [Nitrospirota bacterium]
MKILSNQKGFSLLELLIALTVLAIGLLGLAGLHIAAIQGNVSGFKISTATAVAQERIEVLKALDGSAAALTAGAHADDGNQVVQGITYNRSYTIQDNTPVSGTSTLTLTVTWVEPRTGVTRNTSVFTRINKG